MKIFILLLALIVLIINYRRRMLMSSSSIWVVCYIMIFVVYPLYGTNEIAKNADEIDFYAIVGISMFIIGLMFAKERMKRKHISSLAIYKQRYPKFRIGLIFFGFFSVLTVYMFLNTYGFGAVGQILIGAITSKDIMRQSHGEVVGLYGISQQLMMPFALSVWMAANTKSESLIKLVCAAVFVIIHILFSFTRIFLITYLAIILFYELRNKTKNQQAVLLAGGGVILAIILIMMNFFRSFGLGKELDFDQLLAIDYIFESTDFGASYYWFDRLLSYGYPAISPLAWFKFLFIFIPRSIWPTKPEQTSMQILQKVDPAMASTGYSTAGNSVLGESFAILGIIGIFVFPLIWGYICGVLDRKYNLRLQSGIENSASNIMYYLFAVFVVLSSQRGDWSQYMISFVYFWTIPLLFISHRKRINIAKK